MHIADSMQAVPCRWLPVGPHCATRTPWFTATLFCPMDSSRFLALLSVCILPVTRMQPVLFLGKQCPCLPATPLMPSLGCACVNPMLPPCAAVCFLQRRELIGAVDFSQQQQRFAREQDVLEGKQDVTASLRRTRQLMMQNLEQTHGNISVLGACAAAGFGRTGYCACRRIACIHACVQLTDRPLGEFMLLPASQPCVLAGLVRLAGQCRIVLSLLLRLLI